MSRITVVSAFHRYQAAANTGAEFMVAAIELPSVIRFPWAGALILGVFAAVAVAAVALARWARAETEAREIPRGDAWVLGLEAVAAAMVIATVAVGPMAAMLLGIVGITLGGGLFARQRDAAVPQHQRVLTRAGLQRSWASLQGWRARRKARLPTADKTAARSWKDWAGQLLRKKAPGEVEPAGPPEPVLKLLLVSTRLSPRLLLPPVLLRPNRLLLLLLPRLLSHLL